MPFRAAACTGALYHLEIYVVCAELPDLPAGVYHYGAHDHALRRLRPGDHRGVLVEASGAQPDLAAAPLAIVWTCTFWRNAWKYQARTYRHAYWDGGTALANLLAVARAADLPARVVLGYADDPVNALIDLDPGREAAIALVTLGAGAPPAPPAPTSTTAIGARSSSCAAATSAPTPATSTLIRSSPPTPQSTSTSSLTSRQS